MSKAEPRKIILEWKATENPQTGRPFTFNEIAAGPLKALGFSGAWLEQLAKRQPGCCPSCHRKLRKMK